MQHYPFDVMLRWMSVENNPTVSVQLEKLLDAAELIKCKGYHFVADRQAYIAAHGLLRLMLSFFGGYSPCEWRFDISPNGKPRVCTELDRQHIHFSLSHSRGMVACAVALGCEVGIDVEALSQPVSSLRIADDLFSSEEAELLRQLPQDQRDAMFYRLWTLKEAYLKGIGEGITAPLDANYVSLVSIAPGGPSSTFDVSLNWQLFEYVPAPKYALAVAIRRKVGDRVAIDASPFYFI